MPHNMAKAIANQAAIMLKIVIDRLIGRLLWVIVVMLSY